MEIFEQKGLIKILLFLLENGNKTNSLYNLKNSTNLSKFIINECIEVLKNNKLIDKHEKIGSRLSTEIILTLRGIQIALIFREIKLLYENNHN